jgi:hypothetical protein
MTSLQQTPDFSALKIRARKMSQEALVWNANDASEAAEMAEGLERAGCRTSKSGGYYRDEAGVYRTELRIRRKRAQAR